MLQSGMFVCNSLFDSRRVIQVGQKKHASMINLNAVISTCSSKHKHAQPLSENKLVRDMKIILDKKNSTCTYLTNPCIVRTAVSLEFMPYIPFLEYLSSAPRIFGKVTDLKKTNF